MDVESTLPRALSAWSISLALMVGLGGSSLAQRQDVHPACAGATAAHSNEVRFLAESKAAMDRMMGAMNAAPTGNVDADFAAMMIPHHQGAIDMALAELRYGKNEQLRRLAQGMIVEQQQEIAAMRLAAGQPLPRADASAQAHPAPAIPKCK
jgi:hypothetical protein